MPGGSVTKGRLTIEYEQFTFGTDTSRARPTKVSGTLSNFTSVEANWPMSHYAGGDPSGTADAMEGFDRGHVIMCSHSGVSDPENIVPMYPCFNQAGGLWRELEQRIANYTTLTLPSRGSPRVMEMTVEIKYEGTTDARFPSAFLVTVFDNSAQGGHLYFKGVKLDRLRFPHLPTSPVQIDPLRELGSSALEAIVEADQVVTGSDWTVENLYPDAILAPLATVPSRPYAMLDYLWLRTGDAEMLAFLTDGCRYRHRQAAQFHERQKMLIHIVNSMRNDGYLKSDYPGDTTDSLIIGSGQRSAQVDHVYPYTAYGGNLFSNALLASGAYNNRMRAASPGDKWNDRSGVTLYDTTRHH